MSCSNASREKLSCSHGAASPGRVAVLAEAIHRMRRLQPLIWFGLIIVATTAEAQTWKPRPNEPLEKYDIRLPIFTGWTLHPG